MPVTAPTPTGSPRPTDYTYWVGHPGEAFTYFVARKGATGYPRDYIIAVITSVSMVFAVPPWVPLAIAYKESGWDPFALGDIEGGAATSFGLFQLHEGGELPKGKDKFWAEDPVNNSRVAIATIAREYHKTPRASAGDIGVRAQRPAENVRPAYKADVDRYAHLIRFKGTGALKTARTFKPHNEPGNIPVNPDTSGQVDPQGITGGAFTGTSNFLLSHLGLPNIGVLLRVFAGGIAVLLGLLFLFHNKVTVANAGKAAAFL